MTLDIDTLMISGAFVSILSAGFLALAWWRDRETRAALYWSAANLLVGLGIGLHAFHDEIPVYWLVFSLGLFVVAAGLFWAAARRFNKRRPYPALVVVTATIWIIACFFPTFVASFVMHSVPVSLIIAAYSFAAAWEFWRDGEERLFSRWPLIVLLCLHGTAFLASNLDLLVGAPASAVPETGSIFVFVHFEHMIFTIGTAIFLIAMIKERHEFEQKREASRDSLSGLANRGAFLEGAENALRRQRQANEPIAVLIFDLDRFKTINDTLGHAIGDRVIECFAKVARESIRSTDLVGRIGGEEFGVVLLNAGYEVGFAYAERVRSGFQLACGRLPDGAVNATVSVGVSVCDGEDFTLSELLRRADAALYRAKAQGRNRTALVSEAPSSGDSSVIRIA